jgi:hypothetical protein
MRAAQSIRFGGPEVLEIVDAGIAARSLDSSSEQTCPHDKQARTLRTPARNAAGIHSDTSESRTSWRRTMASMPPLVRDQPAVCG